MGVNGQKWNFQANGRRWPDSGVETTRNSFLSVYIIVIASNNNIFVNKSGGGVKGLPMSRRKWEKNSLKLNFQANCSEKPSVYL